FSIFHSPRTPRAQLPPFARGAGGVGSNCPAARTCSPWLPLDHQAIERNPEMSHEFSLSITCSPRAPRSHSAEISHPPWRNSPEFRPRLALGGILASPAANHFALRTSSPGII